MIARKTLAFFLLALLLGSGLAFWNARHPDDCYRYLRGDDTLPSMQAIVVSGQTVFVPCDQWYPRQTMYVQTACVLEVALVGAFLVLAVGDGLNWKRRRMAR